MHAHHPALFFLTLSAGPIVYALYLMIFKSTPAQTKSMTLGQAIETYPLFDYYSKSQGYSREYMDELIKFLAQKQISAKYAYDESQMYHLFVLRGQETQAKNFIARFREKESKVLKDSAV